MRFQKNLVAGAVTAALLGLAGCASEDATEENETATLSSSTITLTNDNIYMLASGFPGTKIGNGDAADANAANDDAMTLDIQAGTLIIGDVQEALVVTRGSKISANGTAADPIVMTSKTQFDNWAAGGDGTSGRGEWAGLALMGYARTGLCGGNFTNCDVEAEGNVGSYAGDNDADSSGNMSYVVIRHAGNDIDGNGNELNGLTMFATGSGTQIDHIQVHKGYDDGIEHFGSADFMKYIALTDNKDDSFDWGHGYTGGVQFMYVRQANDAADRGIEADNDKHAMAAVPVSKPKLANITLVGPTAPEAGSSAEGADGMLFRVGTGANVHNAIVAGFPDNCVDIDEQETMTAAFDGTNYTGQLTVDNTFISCTTNFKQQDQDFNGDGTKDLLSPTLPEWFANSGSGNNSTTAADLSATGVAQNAFAAATTGLTAQFATDANFTATNYAGAFDPAAPTQWTEGWTVSIHGNNTVWAPATGVTPVSDGSCPAGTTFVKAITVPGTSNQMDLCQLQRRYDASDIIK